MKINAYSIKDTKIGFALPFYQQNDHVAVRSFTRAVNDPASEYSKIAEDIELWKVGEYDTETGILTSDVAYICKGLDVKKLFKEE